ncbi:MAG: XisH family protein [Blastocatellia bacterium]
MPARDVFHNAVRKALANDGWTITDDPLRLQWGKKDMYVDLGAEKLIGAEKEGMRIAVEIKSFGGASDVRDLEQAFGQYFVYRAVIKQTQPDRNLFLAVAIDIYAEVFEDDLGQLLLETYQAPLIVFDPVTEEIVKWIK